MSEKLFVIGVGVFTIAFALLYFSGTEVTAVVDPVATYSGMAVVCDGRVHSDYWFYGSIYALPFPEPPGHPFTYDEFGGFFASDQVKTKGGKVGISTVPDHYIGSNVTRCEAWVSIIPKDDPETPIYGSSLAGTGVHSGLNITVDVVLGIMTQDANAPVLALGTQNFYVWKGEKLSNNDKLGKRSFRVFADIGQSGSLDCDKLVIGIGNDTIGGKGINILEQGTIDVSENSMNLNKDWTYQTSAYNDIFGRDDCVLINYGMAVYYDVSLPAGSRGTIESIDEEPVSVREIVRGVFE